MLLMLLLLLKTRKTEKKTQKNNECNSHIDKTCINYTCIQQNINLFLVSGGENKCQSINHLKVVFFLLTLIFPPIW